MNEEIKHGDIFIEATGFHSTSGGNQTTYSMFEYDATLESGAGRIYNPNGEPTHYWWARPVLENRFDNVPDDILFSFQHGERTFSAPTPEDNIDFETLIRSSNFTFISPEDVEVIKTLATITTMEDVRKHWALIRRTGKVSVGVASICIEAMGVEISPPRNGEIGIHSMQILCAFSENMLYIEKELGLVP